MDGFLDKFFPSIKKREAETPTVHNLYCQYNSQTLQLMTSSLFIAGALCELSGTTGKQYTTESIKIPHLSGSQSSSRLLTSWLLIVAKPRHAWHPVAVSHITLHIKPTVSPGVPSLSVLLPMAMLVAPTRVTLPDCQCACSLAEPESWTQASHDVSLNILMWSKLYALRIPTA